MRSVVALLYACTAMGFLGELTQPDATAPPSAPVMIGNARNSRGFSIDGNLVYITSNSLTVGSAFDCWLTRIDMTTTQATLMSPPAASADCGATAVDETRAYFSTPGLFRSMPKLGSDGGGMLETTDSMQTILVDGNTIYYTTTKGGIRHAPKATLAPFVELAPQTGSDTSAIVQDAQYVYVTRSGDGTIVRVKKDGTAPMETLSSGEASPRGLLLVGDTLYYTVEGSRGTATGALRKLSISAPSPTTILSNLASPHGIATDGSRLYWLEADRGTVVRAAFDGSSPQILASGYVMCTGGKPPLGAPKCDANAHDLWAIVVLPRTIIYSDIRESLWRIDY